ncbi:MAG: hypothetical protein KGZ75_06955 [Syntrophomonadaceae bacterium]|nr:hypothetical protein [Syntrophomonadaceae bacterium]
MAKVLTADKKAKVKKAIFDKADKFGYASCGRNDSGRFMDELVNDPEVGGVLKEYMSKERIRTYIKDGVLNAYTKELVRKALKAASHIETIRQMYSVESSVIQKCKGKEAGVVVSRSADGRIFVTSNGTVLKWETALRKALEIIAREPGLTVNGTTPAICLHLAVVSPDINDGEKKHITDALDAISVKARFSGG